MYVQYSTKAGAAGQDWVGICVPINGGESFLTATGRKDDMTWSRDPSFISYFFLPPLPWSYH